MAAFLPMTREEMAARGWEGLDFLFLSGDAYVDHPAFAPALICRLLEAEGYKVGLLCQVDWRQPDSVKALGRPRLGVLVCGGNLDSLLCHYTVSKKRRMTDKYTAGGQIGKRPDHAAVVYARLAKAAWPELPCILGGLEASLRRFVHYDYWEDRLLPSILEDSGADLLIYGMGERQVKEVAAYLAGGARAEELHHLAGTAYLTSAPPDLDQAVELPSYEAILADRRLFALAYQRQYLEQDPIRGRQVVQKGRSAYLVQNPPAQPLTTAELDAVYALPFQRTYHPSYASLGGVPALAEVRFSLVSSRGCFGSCAFCAIHAHQGRIVQARSHASLLAEAAELTRLPGFKGYIHDVGGPTANFRHPSCQKQLQAGTCRERQCLYPSPCPQLDADHRDYLELLRRLRALPGVKKVFIRSGLRYDYILADKRQDFLPALCRYHVSGQLKVAPEHVVPEVLARMGKPPAEVFLAFCRRYEAENRKLGLRQYLVPYFISSHPGCTLEDAVALAEFLRDRGCYPEQVQDFIPTPGSAATAMYYSGIDPASGQEVYVARDPHDKALQRALLRYKEPANQALVVEALQRARRQDLIGYGPRCLVRPLAANRQPGPQPASQKGRTPARNRLKEHKKKKPT